MNNRNELPKVLYRFDHAEDRHTFVEAFQGYFELLICQTDEDAKLMLEKQGELINALVIDQEVIDSSLSALAKSVHPHILSIQLHRDIALDAIVSLLDSGLTDKCFAKPYDANIIRSEIFTAAMGVDSNRPILLIDDDADKIFSVLIVDDEKIATKFLSKQLQRLDCPCHILVAENAEEALGIIEEQKNNLAMIISDHRMPGISGNQLLSEVQKYCPHIIRMLTSAYEEVDIALNAVNEGRIYRYIKKPWDAEEINSIIKLSLFEFKSRLKKASEQALNIRQQYQLILDQRKKCLDENLSEAVSLFEGEGGLEFFYACLNRVTPLPPGKASLRVSQETDIETCLVSDFSNRVKQRLLSLKDKRLPTSSETVLALIRRLCESDAEETQYMLNEAVSCAYLDVEMLVSLQQLLTSSGLDFRAMVLLDEGHKSVLKLMVGKDLSLYRHILSAHTQVSVQMLQQQCELLILLLICRKLDLDISIESGTQSFQLSIKFPNACT